MIPTPRPAAEDDPHDCHCPAHREADLARRRSARDRALHDGDLQVTAMIRELEERS